MSEFRVPTVPLQVEVRCIDGRRFVGDVFMPAHSSRHQGPMRPTEWVNTIPTFFPFRPYESDMRTIFNRHQVIAVTVAADRNQWNDDETLGNPVYEVAIEAGGQRFVGRIVADMPRSQQRVVDLFNGDEAFITVQAGDHHHLVQKEHITRVLEPQEA
jgi:hypothetical protein